MSAHVRPSASEKADACDRFVDLEKQAHALIGKMFQVLHEGRPSGSYSGHPKFPFIGDQVEGFLSAAQDALWKAHKVIAVDGYDNHRELRMSIEVAS